MKYILERISTEYDLTEDRVRVAGELAEGQVIIVWLTRRLVGFMVPVLLERLEPSVPTGAPKPVDAYVELRKEFAQHAARQAIEPAPPITVDKVCERLLSTAVDVAHANGIFSLNFRDDDGHAASLAVNETGLRQWLHLLHRADQVGGWALGVWPAWLGGIRHVAPDQGMTVH